MLTFPRRCSQNCYEIRNSVGDADEGTVVKVFGNHSRWVNFIHAWLWYVAHA